MAWIIAALGTILLLAVLQDASEAMLLPRRVHRHVRFTRFYFQVARAIWRGVALRLRTGSRARTLPQCLRRLVDGHPVRALAVGLITAFGLLEWAAQSSVTSSVSEQIYMSGVTFFTLGYGDVVPHSGAARALSVIEAGTGIGLIAIVIGYLPVL